FGFFLMKSIGAYSAAAGMSGLPNTAAVPLAVRVSAIRTMSPLDSSIVITGSTFEIASMFPDSTAAIAPDAVGQPSKIPEELIDALARAWAGVKRNHGGSWHHTSRAA